MNQALLNVLEQDPTKTPGIYLSFRWLLPLISLFGNVFGWCFLPLLSTWLGCFFIDSADLWDQVFSLYGLIYITTFMGMIPKPNTSSKLWLDTHLFTLVVYSLYFAELGLIAYYKLNLEYSLSWIFDILFSTSFTFLFYAVLVRFKLATSLYFKTLVGVYLMMDMGSLLALEIITPYYTDKVIGFLCAGVLIYGLLPCTYSSVFSKPDLSFTQRDRSISYIRCIFWGALSVWVDYLAITPFYVLEMILTTESHKRKDSVLYYCRFLWTTHKFTILTYLGELKRQIRPLNKKSNHLILNVS